MFDALVTKTGDGTLLPDVSREQVLANVRVVGFTVSGLGFTVSGLGFRVSDLGFRV